MARRRLLQLVVLLALTTRWCDGSSTAQPPPPSVRPSIVTTTPSSSSSSQQQQQQPQDKKKKPSAGVQPSVRPATAVGRGGGNHVHVQDTDLKKLLKKGQLEAARFDDSTVAGDSPPTQGPSQLALWRRAMYLLYFFSAAIFTALLAFVSERFRSPYWYRMITCAISRAGAAFIKWGQWASARPDIFPEELCTTLAMLHSFAPTHAFAFTRQAVEEAFGQPLEEVFDAFDPEPVASGSIAQVHSAVLKGRRVAVKVRHPGVAEQIEMDFRVMKKVAEFADRIPALKFLNLGHSMEQFSHTLASQTRLDVEGKHLLLLNHNFRGWRKTLRFPEPLVLSEGVLVESWEEGVIISDFIARYSKWRELEDEGCEMCGKVFGAYTHLRMFVQDSLLYPIKPFLDAWKQERRQRREDAEDLAACAAEDAAEDDPSSPTGKKLVPSSGSSNRRRAPLTVELAHFIVSTGEDLYLKMLLVDNLMHADLHPGNILIHVTEKGRPTLTLVDAGMVAELTDLERTNFIGLLEAMGTGDGDRAARHILGFSLTQTCVGEDAELFAQEVKEVFLEHCRGYYTNVDMGVVLREALAKVRKYRVRVDVNYATLLINLLCLEGLASALLPSYNLLDRAKPLLTPHSKKILRPFFRRIYPILLALKRHSEGALFTLLKKTGNVQQPPPAYMPADRHAPRTHKPAANTH